MDKQEILNKLKKHKIISLILVIIFLGSGIKIYKSVKVNHDINVSINAAIKNSKINKYVVKSSTSGYLNSTISITVNDEFAKLSADDMSTNISEVYNKADDEIIDKAYKNNVDVNINNLVGRAIYVKTSNGVYSFNYSGLKLPDGKLSAKNSEPASTSTNSTSYSSSSSNNATTWSKTAGSTDGNDWAIMNDSQKKDIILGVMETLKGKGYKFDVSASWFIDGLNSYYGSSVTDRTTVNDAFAKLGVTGNVIHK